MMRLPLAPSTNLKARRLGVESELTRFCRVELLRPQAGSGTAPCTQNTFGGGFSKV